MTNLPEIGKAGRELVDRIVGGLPDDVELDEREQIEVETAGRMTDRMAVLSEVIAKEGVMIEGSKGQSRCHPALAELTKLELARDRLLGNLAIPVEIGLTETEASRRARRAANTRHNRQRAKQSRGRS